MNQIFRKLFTVITTLFLFFVGGIGWATAQENDGSAVEQQSQEEIDQALENILKNLPPMEGESDSMENEKPEQPKATPSGSDKEDKKESGEEDKDAGDPGIVVELQKQMEELKAKNQESSKKDLTTLKRLAGQLKVAKTIEQQFKKMAIKKGTRAANDSFVVANLEVQPNGNELEVSFQATQGEKQSIRSMFEFLAATPAQGFRDFRIISRHNDSNVELALNDVRKEYDMAKERERQFLEYVQQQQARMARVKASRRC